MVLDTQIVLFVGIAHGVLAVFLQGIKSLPVFHTVSADRGLVFWFTLSYFIAVKTFMIFLLYQHRYAAREFHLLNILRLSLSGLLRNILLNRFPR